MAVEFLKDISKIPKPKRLTERYDSPQCSWEGGRTFDLQRRSQRSEIKRHGQLEAQTEGHRTD